MDWTLVAVIGLVALALLFDFTNGFHDAANSVSTVVATRALPAKWAPAFAAFFNFLAFFFIGTAVANTVAKVINSDYVTLAAVFGALVGAISWNYATWFVGMPSSSSHALIGGLVGAGLAVGGIDAIDWSSVEKTVVAILASPLVAFTVAFVSMYLVYGLQKLTRWHDNARPFKALQLISAAAVSFGHGANDAQKTMGAIAALLGATGYLTANADGTFPVPTWVAFAAYTAIAIGTLWGGWKIIETMGLKITTLHANSGVAANIGATTAIFGATNFGIPISTTHAAASSVMGAGVGSGRGLNFKVVGEMLAAWIVTVPATLIVAFLIVKMTMIEPAWLAYGAVGSLMFVFFGWVAYAMMHTITAADLEKEIPAEETLDEEPPAHLHPQLEGHGPLQ